MQRDPFSPTNCPKPKDMKSIIRYEKEKQQNLTDYLVFLSDETLKKMKSRIRVSADRLINPLIVGKNTRNMICSEPLTSL